MPVTITLPSPNGLVAPWSNVRLTSDFIGPLPTGARFVVQFFTGTEPQPGQNVGLTQTLPTSTVIRDFNVGIQAPGEGFQVDPKISWRPTTSVKVSAILEQSTGVTIDSGTTTGEWQPTSNILSQPKQTTGGGGLTEEQSLQLSQTHLSTYPTVSFDSLLLQEITQGPAGGTVGAQLPLWIWGVIVRIATVPPDLHVNTPDGDYWTASLAVVRIYRATDLWMRIPVHTSSKIITLIDQGVTAAIATIVPLQWLLQMSVQVSFREGVTGQVFLMNMP